MLNAWSTSLIGDPEAEVAGRKDLPHAEQILALNEACIVRIISSVG